MVQYETIAKLFLAVLLLTILFYISIVVLGVWKPVMPWSEYIEKFAIIGYTNEKYIEPEKEFKIIVEPNPDLTKYKNKNYLDLWICVDNVYQYYKPLYVEKKADYAFVEQEKRDSKGNIHTTNKFLYMKIFAGEEDGEEYKDKSEKDKIINYILNMKKYSQSGECYFTVPLGGKAEGHYYYPCNGNDGSPIIKKISSSEYSPIVHGGETGAHHNEYSLALFAKWLSVDFFSRTTLVEDFDRNSSISPKDNIKGKCWPGDCGKKYFDVNDSGKKFDCDTACKGNSICNDICNKIPSKIVRGDTPILTSLSYKVNSSSVDDSQCVPYDPEKQLNFNMMLTTKDSSGSNIPHAEAYKPVYGPVYIYFRLYDKKKDEMTQLWPISKDSAMLVTSGMPYSRDMPTAGLIPGIIQFAQKRGENVVHLLAAIPHSPFNKDFDVTKNYITAKLPFVVSNSNSQTFKDNFGNNLRYGKKYDDVSYISPMCATGFGRFWYYSTMMRIPPSVMGQSSNDNFIKSDDGCKHEQWLTEDGYYNLW